MCFSAVRSLPKYLISPPLDRRADDDRGAQQTVAAAAMPSAIE